MASSSEMTVAFVPENAVQQSIIESVLEEAGIGYITRNAGVQNLVGLGQIGGFNLATGAVEIMVSLENLTLAKQHVAAVLNSISHEEAPDRPREDDDDPDLAQKAELVARYSRYSVIWSILWLGGIGSLLAITFGLKACVLLKKEPKVPNTMPVFGVIIGLLVGLIGLAVWLVIWGSIIRF